MVKPEPNETPKQDVNPVLSTNVPDTSRTSEQLRSLHQLVSDFLNPEDYRDLNVMVVDDTTASLMRIAPLLSDHGYAVRPIKDSSSAVESAVTNPPDLILLDAVMPAPDGFEVCQQLKAHPVTAHIPVIMLSGREDEKYKLRAFELGAEDYVVKPFQAKELLARVKRHISNSLLTQQLKQRSDRLGEQLRHYLRNERMLIAGIAHSRDGLIILDGERGEIIQLNASLQRLLGYDASIVGKHYHHLSPDLPEDLHALEPAKSQHLQFYNAQRQVVTLQTHAYPVFVDARPCLLLQLSSPTGAEAAAASSALPQRIAPAMRHDAKGNNTTNQDNRQQHLLEALLHRADVSSLFPELLALLLTQLDAREGYVLLAQPHAAARNTSNATLSEPLQLPLEVIAQRQRDPKQRPQLMLNEILTAKHVLCQSFHQYPQLLWCDTRVAHYLTYDLQQLLQGFAAQWLLLMPLRNPTHGELSGGVVVFGDRTLQPGRELIAGLELIASQLSLRLAQGPTPAPRSS